MSSVTSSIVPTRKPSITSSLIWTPQALQDIQRLYQFLATRNRDAAKRAVSVIRDSVNILAKQPEVGRPVPEMALEFREWPINFGDSGYVVLYHFVNNSTSKDSNNEPQAIILSVKHQKEIAYNRQ